MMRTQTIETRGLLRPIFCSLFFLGNIAAILVAIVILSGHQEWIADRTLFGLHLLPDGPAPDIARGLLASIVLFGIIIASGVYALFMWLLIYVGASGINSLIGLRNKRAKP